MQLELITGDTIHIEADSIKSVSATTKNTSEVRLIGGGKIIVQGSVAEIVNRMLKSE